MGQPRFVAASSLAPKLPRTNPAQSPSPIYVEQNFQDVSSPPAVAKHAMMRMVDCDGVATRW